MTEKIKRTLLEVLENSSLRVIIFRISLELLKDSRPRSGEFNTREDDSRKPERDSKHVEIVFGPVCDVWSETAVLFRPQHSYWTSTATAGQRGNEHVDFAGDP